MVLPTDDTVRTDAGLVEVTENGASPQRVSRAEATLAEQHRPPRRRLLVPGAVAVVMTILALLASVNDHPRGALVLLLGAVVAAGAAVYAIRRQRQAAQRVQTLVAELHAQLAEGQRRAQAARQAQQDTALGAAQLAAKVTEQLQSDGRVPEPEPPRSEDRGGSSAVGQAGGVGSTGAAGS